MTAQHEPALALAEKLAAMHAEVYEREPRGEILTSVYLEDEAGDSRVIACPWADPAQRMIVITVLREMIRELGIIRYALWCEAWCVVGLSEAEVADYQHGNLHKHPQRVECVFTVVSDIAHRDNPVGIQQIIHRDTQGRVTHLERTPTMGDSIAGALSDLFPERSYQ